MSSVASFLPLCHFSPFPHPSKKRKKQLLKLSGGYRPTHFVRRSIDLSSEVIGTHWGWNPDLCVGEQTLTARHHSVTIISDYNYININYKNNASNTVNNTQIAIS